MDSENLIFRYQPCTPLTLNSLRNGELFFASAKELNDPLDSIPRYTFKGSEELWQRLSEYIFMKAFEDFDRDLEGATLTVQQLYDISQLVGAKIKRKLKNKALSLGKLKELFLTTANEETVSVEFKRFEKTELLRRLTSAIDVHVVAFLKEQVRYSCSFSLTPNNPTMWGHYANSYRGFALIFNVPNWTLKMRSPKNIFPTSKKLGVDFYELGIAKHGELKLFKVKYQNSPDPTNAFLHLIPRFFYTEQEDHYDVPAILEGDATAKKEHSIGLVKYLDWKYEKEIRCFFPRDDLKMDGPIPAPRRTLKFHPTQLRGIILGPNMSSADKRNVIAAVDTMRTSTSQELNIPFDQMPEFTVLQARHKEDEYPLEIVALADLDKPHDFLLEARISLSHFGKEHEPSIQNVKENLATPPFNDAQSVVYYQD